MQYVSERVDTVEGKLAAIKSFDYDGRFITAQSDLNLRASGSSNINVAIDNANHAAYLRFGSAEVVDTVDAVWFISKTGNTINNDFGDVLHPNAQRRDIRLFLQATSVEARRRADQRSGASAHAREGRRARRSARRA